MKCGHVIHSRCYNNYVNSGNYKCPICKKSLFDDEIMEYEWNRLRLIKRHINIPDDLKNIKIHIYCNDCCKESNTEFCIDNLLECKNCGGFNTQKI
jgi:RING finger and CHY zinc finger domain-containing protein 1